MVYETTPEEIYAERACYLINTDEMYFEILEDPRVCFDTCEKEGIIEPFAELCGI